MVNGPFIWKIWAYQQVWRGPLLITATKKLQWRHNGHDSISNHQPYDCLLKHLFRRRSKKTSKLPITGEFPTQMASYAENVSIWWRHYGITDNATDACSTLPAMCALEDALNSSPPSAAYIPQWTGSALVQIWLVAYSTPNHYPNQCWIIVIWRPGNNEILIWKLYPYPVWGGGIIILHLFLASSGGVVYEHSSQYFCPELSRGPLSSVGKEYHKGTFSLHCCPQEPISPKIYELLIKIWWYRTLH